MESLAPHEHIKHPHHLQMPQRTQASVMKSRPNQQLKTMRLRKGWTQPQLAELLGTDPNTVSRWERGLQDPSPHHRSQLGQLFGVSLSELGLSPFHKGAAFTRPIPSFHPPVIDPAIPVKPSQVIGRDDQVALAKQQLGEHGVVVINGLPGIGKTTLATTLAHDEELRTAFPDGVLWAGLGPAPNFPQILQRWGVLLGLSIEHMEALSGTDALLESLRRTLGSRSLLIVLDDIWNLEDVLPLKLGSAQCSYVFTTRFRALAAQLATERAMELHELSLEQSLCLFRHLAGESATKTQKTHTVVQAVGGHPLALTLMANYIRKHAYSGQPRRLQMALTYLSSMRARFHMEEVSDFTFNAAGRPEQQRISLQSVIALSDHQLPEDARTALYSLSVFRPKPQRFSEEAAIAIGCSTESLDALVDAGLVESAGPGQYMLHQVIADYATLHLMGITTQEQLVTYVRDCLAVYQYDFGLLYQESDVILAGLDAAYLLGKHEELIWAVDTVLPFLFARGWHTIAEQQVQRAHEMALVTGDPLDLARVLLCRGTITQHQGSFALALQFFQQGLALMRQQSEQTFICRFLTHLSSLENMRGQFPSARTLSEEGILVARQLGDNQLLCPLLITLATALYQQGETRSSETAFQEGVALARHLGRFEYLSRALIHLGRLAYERGDFTQADAHYQEALALARQLDYKEELCLVLIHIGTMAYHRQFISESADQNGNVSSLTASQDASSLVQARACLEEALDLARELHRREWMSQIFGHLAGIAEEQAHSVETEILAREALALARQLGTPATACSALYILGEICQRQERLEEAVACFREMLTTVPHDQHAYTGWTYFGMAKVAAAWGQERVAWRLAQMSVRNFEAIGSSMAGQVRHWLAQQLPLPAVQEVDEQQAG